jgi:tryptophan synthase alpha chain
MAREGRIASVLAGLARQRRAALVPYLCVGDPDMDTSLRSIRAAVEAGADMIELGIPFSDPIADGPIIQAASQRSLAAGSSLPRVLDAVTELRRDIDVPLILFGYYNPFFRYGEQRLAHDARAAGADAILCVDLPPEEADAMVAAASSEDLDRVFLLAPTSDESRMRRVAKVASGFVYFVSVTGVTGARSQAPAGIEDLVTRVRALTRLPVGVGFGISSPEQAAAVGRYADLVAVGSALVRAMHDAGTDAPRACADFVRGMRQALDAVAGEQRRAAR